MSNLDEQTKKIIAGSVLGGIIGLGAISIYCMTRKSHTKTSIEIIKDTVNHVVQAIDACKDSAQQAAQHAAKEVDNKIKEGESMVSNFIELASVGINLWQKILKRR